MIYFIEYNDVNILFYLLINLPHTQSNVDQAPG